jgi:hypothetical protein
MKTVLLSCFLVLIVAVGMLFCVREGFDTVGDKREWIATMITWQKAYTKNVATATPQQTQYNALINADSALSRIDNLGNAPYNLTQTQLGLLYRTETAAMTKDITSWNTLPDEAAATPNIPTVYALFGSGLGSSSGMGSSSGSGPVSGLGSSSGSGLMTPPADPVYQAPAANTIARSVEEKADPEESGSPSDWQRCPDMSKYIKKDEIPCWTCTL